MNRKLRAARVEIGLTQAQLAKLIDMPASTYQKKEQGQTEFTIKEAIKIAEILNKSIYDIFLMKNQPKLLYKEGNDGSN